MVALMALFTLRIEGFSYYGTLRKFKPVCDEVIATLQELGASAAAMVKRTSNNRRLQQKVHRKSAQKHAAQGDETRKLLNREITDRRQKHYELGTRYTTITENEPLWSQLCTVQWQRKRLLQC